jgi:alpha-D-xyloside xylohydrolase
MLRWIENAVFLPVMRVHGYQSDTEPWNYDDETKKIFVRCIKEREALKPYFESLASRVAEEDYTLMRPLIFDFADDEEALKQELEYMCGPKYLVCPVVKLGVTSSCVYLPKNKKGWTDHYSGRHYDGGQYVTVVVSKEHIPVFERK